MSESLEGFIEMLLRSGLITQLQLDDVRNQLAAEPTNLSSESLALGLADSGHLSDFQAHEVKEGNIEKLVVGDYVILHPVGRGGMGEVFRARHCLMKREVAVKFTLPDASGDISESSASRFQREVEAASSLMHPNIVSSLDAGRRGDVCYLVMEFVRGMSLTEHVLKNGPMEVLLALDSIIQAAQGLEFAHSKGVIHRDVKPSNLLITDDGQVKILDMGLVRMNAYDDMAQTKTIAAEDQLTKNGQLLGTVDFMAPEQAVDAHTADARSDIYGLGCTLYYLLTGLPPYRRDLRASTMSRIIAHRENPIPKLADLRDDVPGVLQPILEKMLAKNPRRRYQTANELIIDLRKARPVVELGQVMLTETQTAPPKTPSTLRRTKWAVAAGLLVLTGFAATLAIQRLVPNEYIPQALSDIDLDSLSNSSNDAPPPKIDRLVDLLSLVDLDQHSKSGQGWEKNEDGLLIPAGTPSKIVLPAQLPEQFRLDLTVERIDASGPFVIGVNATGQSYYLIIDAIRKNGQSRMTGLGTYQGRIAKTVFDELPLQQGERIDISLIGTQQKVVLESGGTVVLEWEGDVGELTLGAGWNVGNVQGFFIGSNNESIFRISQLTVMPLSVASGLLSDSSAQL